jgi:hypothetical protein
VDTLPTPGQYVLVEREIGPRPTVTRHLVVDVTTDADGTWVWYREDCGAGPYGLNAADNGITVEA